MEQEENSLKVFTDLRLYLQSAFQFNGIEKYMKFFVVFKNDKFEAKDFERQKKIF